MSSLYCFIIKTDPTWRLHRQMRAQSRKTFLIASPSRSLSIITTGQNCLAASALHIIHPTARMLRRSCSMPTLPCIGSSSRAAMIRYFILRKWTRNTASSVNYHPICVRQWKTIRWKSITSRNAMQTVMKSWHLRPFCAGTIRKWATYRPVVLYRSPKKPV